MSISNQTGASGFPVPVGTIVAFAGQVIPPKYLLCNGTPYDVNLYPILHELLGGTSTPNLVGGIIGGGTTRQTVLPGIIGISSASFTIDVANMPAFTTTVDSFSASGTLNGEGQTNSNKQNADPDSFSANDPAVFSNGQDMQSSIGVTGTFVGQLNAHAGDPVLSSNITVNTIVPRTISIQYIVKAGY